MNICSTCGLNFVSVPSFDDHRVGTHDYTYAEGIRQDPPVEDGRRCLDLDEMEQAGWHQDRYGRWKSPIEHPELARVQL
jgi:hypothetical protein